MSNSSCVSLGRYEGNEHIYDLQHEISNDLRRRGGAPGNAGAQKPLISKQIGVLGTCRDNDRILQRSIMILELKLVGGLHRLRFKYGVHKAQT